MALLFADVVARYNAEKNTEHKETEAQDTVKLTNKVADYLSDLDNVDTYTGVSEDNRASRPQSVFVASIESEYYAKAQEDIANTKIGNKCIRKKNFRQVMQESFFYGSNRFGTNLIA